MRKMKAIRYWTNNSGKEKLEKDERYTNESDPYGNDENVHGIKQRCRLINNE